MNNIKTTEEDGWIICTFSLDGKEQSKALQFDDNSEDYSKEQITNALVNRAERILKEYAQ